jgi:hypothetical protein
MHRVPLTLVTIATVGAGWVTGTLVHHHRPKPETVPERRENVPAPESLSSDEASKTSRNSPDVFAVLNQIKTEFGAEHLGDERGPKLFEELKGLNDEQFLSAIANLSSEKHWLGKDLAQLLIGYWTERNLPAARQWILGLGEKTNINFLDSFFETWSRANLPEMFEWMETHSDELKSKTHRDRAIYNIAKAAWQLDPERGIQLVKRLDPEAGALWNLYHQWAEHDPKAASARLLQETNAKIRERALPGLVYAWAPRDPAAAKAWAESIPDPLVAASTVTLVGQVIGSKDPRAGADYLAQIPQSNGTRQALQQVIEQWAGRDANAALEWVAGFENASVGDWIVSEVTAKMSAEQRTKAEKHWRTLRDQSREANKAQ